MKTDSPYVGSLSVTQRAPDSDDGSQTTWLCEEPGSECGVLEVNLPDFKPPQTYPEVVEIGGAIESIHQTSDAYRAVANLDGFVPGAIGLAELQLLCPECVGPNLLGSIAPNFQTGEGQIYGELTVDISVPGIGGSVGPHCGVDRQIRATVEGLGAECNRQVPTTSSRGLAVLVLLMIAGSIAVAGAPFARGRPR